MFFRESKNGIQGSKSRSVREKNVFYSNLENAILKSKSLDVGQKNDPKNLINLCKRTTHTPARKQSAEVYVGRWQERARPQHSEKHTAKHTSNTHSKKT